MSLLNPAILFGLALAALPVILHLLLRQKPKKLLFPALRLVEQRRKQNLRRIRLRHIWLLLLRVLAIALIVLAIARPALPAADYSFNLREWLTLAGVVAAGVAAYFVLLHRWRGLPRHVFQLRRAVTRGWATGGTLLALLLCVGCPYQQRIAAEIKAPPPVADLNLPVAAVFLFDTSLSMTYQQEGKTRLDVARDVALNHLSELPAGSRVAVVDTAREDPVLFQPTLSAAQSRIKDLDTKAVCVTLNDRLRTCLLRQEDDRKATLAEQGQVAEDLRKDRFLRRVYVFTDLAATGWRLGGSSLLQKEIERLQTVNVFVVDVGEPSPRNLAVTQLRLSRQQVPTGGRLEVSALIAAEGEPRAVRAELNRMRGDGTLPQGHRELTIEPGSPQWVTFPLLTDLAGPVLHGEVRLVSSDPLVMDDARSFTVQVGDPARVLVVAPNAETARNWMLHLNPDRELVKFRVTFHPAVRFRDVDLANFDVAWFLNVPQLADSDWERIGRFVERGGGAAFVLGSDAILPRAYDRAQAQAFLPARLDAVRRRDGRHLLVEKPDHPIFRKLSETGGLPILQNDVFIDRYFLVEPASGAGVVARFTDEDQSPAIVERVFGKGRTVLLATAVDPAQGALSRWNNLTDTTAVGWPAIALAESLTLYLSRSTENVFNVTAGEEVALRFEPSEGERAFLLKRPEFRQTRATLPAGEASLVIRDAGEIGRYELVDSGDTARPLIGFSVNPPATESDLTRLTPEQLDELLGEGRYQVARTIDELDASVSIADLGREVFPILLLLTIVAFLGEHLVANRFYEADDDVAAGPVAAPKAA